MNLEVKPVCLTIAGLDPSGGAGIVADIKTFTAFGCFAAAAISSVTFQNTTGVFGAVHQTGEAMRGQIAPVFDDFEVASVKTGMLPTIEVIAEVAAILAKVPTRKIVVDPVVRSTSGFDLIDDRALTALIGSLFPIALVVTPNIPEAERICGFDIKSDSDIARAGRRMLEMGAAGVLIKGGHRLGAGQNAMAVDNLFVKGAHKRFEAEFIETTSTHGTGCTLSAAIAANVALGRELIDAIQIAKDFVLEGIKTALKRGSGNSPVNIPTIWPTAQISAKHK